MNINVCVCKRIQTSTLIRTAADREIEKKGVLVNRIIIAIIRCARQFVRYCLRPTSQIILVPVSDMVLTDV
jgi:hypothetical protein